MSADKMPTEIEAVSNNLQDVAQGLACDIAAFPGDVAAICGWRLDPEETEALRQLAWKLGHKARLLEFGLERIHGLCASLADEDRTLFAKTMQLVDMCRFARATPDNGPAPEPTTTALADALEAAVADVQDALRQRFPGEEFPGA